MIVLAWHNQKKGPNSQLGIPFSDHRNMDGLKL